jgi:hypothetical protein
MSRTKIAAVVIVIIALAVGAFLGVAQNIPLSSLVPSSTAQPTIQPTETQTPAPSPTIMPSETQTPNVKLQNFVWVAGWSPIVGVEATCTFNVTIHNLDNKDISGIALTARIYSIAGSQMQHKVDFYDFRSADTGINPFNGTLNAGEIRTVRGIFFSDWNTISNFKNSTTIVEVTLGRDTLDELSYP